MPNCLSVKGQKPTVMPNFLSVKDQSGNAKQIQMYDESSLRQYDEAELIVHITKLQSLLGPENCPSTPRLDATRDELVPCVLDLQRRIFHGCEEALEKEALNLCKVSVAVDAKQKAPSQNWKSPNSKLPEEDEQRLSELYARDLVFTRVDIPRQIDQREEPLLSLPVSFRAATRDTSDDLISVNPAGNGHEVLLQDSCNLFRQPEVQDASHEWKAALEEEKQSRETFEKKMTSAILRCDRLMKDEHISMTEMRGDFAKHLTDILEIVKKEVSSKIVCMDEVRSLVRVEMKSFEESLYQLASRSAQELNSLWASVQELQKSSAARSSVVSSAVEVKVRNIDISLQQLVSRSERELSSLKASVQRLQYDKESDLKDHSIDLKQLQNMVAESRAYEQEIRRETKARETNDQQEKERWTRNVLETQKVRNEAERLTVECGVALRNDFNTERAKLLEQIYELMKLQQMMCEAFSQAIKPEEGPGNKNTLVQELSHIISRLAEKSTELMQSEEHATTEKAHFDRFIKMLNNPSCEPRFDDSSSAKRFQAANFSRIRSVPFNIKRTA